MSVHGKHRKRRPGVHKNAQSPEVKDWERARCVEAKPDWMDDATYARLARLRRSLDAERLG